MSCMKYYHSYTVVVLILVNLVLLMLKRERLLPGTILLVVPICRKTVTGPSVWCCHGIRPRMYRLLKVGYSFLICCRRVWVWIIECYSSSRGGIWPSKRSIDWHYAHMSTLTRSWHLIIGICRHLNLGLDNCCIQCHTSMIHVVHVLYLLVAVHKVLDVLYFL